MIVITRDGKTYVYSGWRAWLFICAALLATWLVFAVFAFVFVGIAMTVGIVLLLLVPAAVVVAAVGYLMRR